MWAPFKGHRFSIAASVLAALVILVLFFGAARIESLDGRWWTLSEAGSLSVVVYILLTYLFLQMFTHIFLAPGSPKQMLADMLSSLLPLGMILSVWVEHFRGHLELSTFGRNAAGLTFYVMALDLLVDIGLVLRPRAGSEPTSV